MAYSIYEWKINPKSSFMTELQSDIIWGHIIWAIRYLEGEEQLQKILKEFENNNSPFIISNGFITGYLPTIKRDILTIKNIKKYLSDKNILTKDNIRKHIKLIDEINSIEFLDIDTFNVLRKGKLSMLYNEVLSNKRCPITLKKLELEAKNSLKLFLQNPDEYKIKYGITTYNDLIRVENITKNTINRITNSSEQNSGSGVFTVKEIFYDSTISIYIKLRDDVNINKFKSYLEYIENNGFGKKASSGRGYFETISFVKRDDLSKMQYDGNGYVVLSNYIPKSGDYKDIVGAGLLTKRGKISGMYSQNENIFKKPFVCFTPGSVFKGNPAPNKGKMLKDIHHNKSIMQYGIPFILGVHINDK